MADKICFGCTLKFGIGIWFSAVQWRRFPHWASIVRAPWPNQPCLFTFGLQQVHSPGGCFSIQFKTYSLVPFDTIEKSYLSAWNINRVTILKYLIIILVGLTFFSLHTKKVETFGRKTVPKTYFRADPALWYFTIVGMLKIYHHCSAVAEVVVKMKMNVSPQVFVVKWEFLLVLQPLHGWIWWWKTFSISL